MKQKQLNPAGRFAMWTAEYDNQLQPAPRIFQVGESIDVDSLPNLRGVNIEYDEPITLGLPAHVGMVCQVTKTGSGYIRVRFGEIGAANSYLAEYHFGANYEL